VVPQPRDSVQSHDRLCMAGTLVIQSLFGKRKQCLAAQQSAEEEQEAARPGRNFALGFAALLAAAYYHPFFYGQEGMLLAADVFIAYAQHLAFHFDGQKLVCHLDIACQSEAFLGQPTADQFTLTRLEAVFAFHLEVGALVLAGLRPGSLWS